MTTNRKNLLQALTELKETIIVTRENDLIKDINSAIGQIDDLLRGAKELYQNFSISRFKALKEKPLNKVAERLRHRTIENLPQLKQEADEWFRLAAEQEKIKAQEPLKPDKKEDQPLINHVDPLHQDSPLVVSEKKPEESKIENKKEKKNPKNLRSCEEDARKPRAKKDATNNSQPSSGGSSTFFSNSQKRSKHRYQKNDKSDVFARKNF